MRNQMLQFINIAFIILILSPLYAKKRFLGIVGVLVLMLAINFAYVTYIDQKPFETRHLAIVLLCLFLAYPHALAIAYVEKRRRSKASADA